ncbi:MAG: hypothetical protein ACYSUI_18765 [Planctomycetota bacterium]|jgi:hypothetical protein
MLVCSLCGESGKSAGCLFEMPDEEAQEAIEQGFVAPVIPPKYEPEPVEPVKMVDSPRPRKFPEKVAIAHAALDAAVAHGLKPWTSKQSPQLYMVLCPLGKQFELAQKHADLQEAINKALEG